MGNLVVGAVVGRSEMIGRTITSSNWPTALCLSDFPDALGIEDEGGDEEPSVVLSPPQDKDRDNRQGISLPNLFIYKCTLVCPNVKLELKVGKDSYISNKKITFTHERWFGAL